jgi:SAM-dependent methyltransferase
MTKEYNNSNSDYYLKLFEKYGQSPKSLGWDKGKQFLRFDQLTKYYILKDCSILDIGCGFGDFATYLKSKDAWESIHYLGIDLIDDFVQVATKSHDQDNFRFISGEFIETNFSDKFDYVISSGVFNLNNDFEDNYKLLENFIAKMLSHCNKSVSIDFLSDQVEFKHSHNFHWEPSRVLKMAYKFSKNISLSNDYFPFEFTIRINKDDTFNMDTTVFNYIPKH